MSFFNHWLEPTFLFWFENKGVQLFLIWVIFWILIWKLMPEQIWTFLSVYLAKNMWAMYSKKISTLVVKSNSFIRFFGRIHSLIICFQLLLTFNFSPDQMRHTFCSMLCDAHLGTISSHFMSSLVSKNGVLLNSFTVHFHA